MSDKEREHLLEIIIDLKVKNEDIVIELKKMRDWCKEFMDANKNHSSDDFAKATFASYMNCRHYLRDILAKVDEREVDLNTTEGK